MTAYVKDADGEEVTIEVPSEFELLEPTKKKVKNDGKSIGTVTWRLKAKKLGDYSVKATLSDGKTKAQTPIKVTAGGIFQ